jgi:hypothetical protein
MGNVRNKVGTHTNGTDDVDPDKGLKSYGALMANGALKTLFELVDVVAS